jgi:hypothetical protein
MGKKNKEPVEKKVKQRNAQAIEDRFKKAMALVPPDENPFKMENEDKIDHFRSLYRDDWASIKTQSRQIQRHNRPKKPQKKFF